MFENKLKEDLKSIFKVKKITYDQPSNMDEQDCIFVEIESSNNQIRDGRVRAQVTCTATIYAQNDKLPFGFVSKAIKQSDPTITKNFFFYDLEQNSKTYQNLVQRSFSFVYFFSGQYDPNIGNIDEVELTIT